MHSKSWGLIPSSSPICTRRLSAVAKFAQLFITGGLFHISEALGFFTMPLHSFRNQFGYCVPGLFKEI
jgi:hypothetical protein